jgi:hypothetical protein
MANVDKSTIMIVENACGAGQITVAAGEARQTVQVVI